ncbi:unnamed protein product, partial [Prorocentrum cordatum]
SERTAEQYRISSPLSEAQLKQILTYVRSQAQQPSPEPEADERRAEGQAPQEDEWQRDGTDPWARDRAAAGSVSSRAPERADQDRWWQGRWSWSGAQNDGNWKWDDSKDGGWSWKERGRDFADPEPWAGWPEYKLWRRKVMRWRQSTDVGETKHADRILKALPIDLQRKLEDIPDEVIMSREGAQRVIDRLDLLSGERVGDEKRKAARECLFSFQRRQGEGLTEYAARIDLAFDRVGTLGLPVPEDWKFMFLEEGVGLDERGQQLMKVLMATKDSYPDALKAIREMDVTRKGHLAHQRARTYHTDRGSASSWTSQWTNNEPSYSVEDDEDDSMVDYDDVSSLNTEGENEIYLAIENLNLYDDELPVVFASMQEDRRKTWKQNRELKRKMKVDRRFFDRTKETVKVSTSRENRGGITNVTGFVFANVLDPVVSETEQNERDRAAQATVLLTVEAGEA